MNCEIMRDQLIAERACNYSMRESLKRRDEEVKSLRDQVAELLRYKETHEAGKRALRKILNPQATAYEVHEDIDRLIREVRELADSEKEMRETNNVWIGGVDWSHDHVVKTMKENEELRLYKEEHERLKRELNRILHPAGDDPENPLLSDLVACVRDDIRHYKDEIDDMKSANCTALNYLALATSRDAAKLLKALHEKDKKIAELEAVLRAKSTIIEKQRSTIMRLNKALARP